MMKNMREAMESSNPADLDKLRSILRDTSKKDALCECIQKRFVDFKSILIADVGPSFQDCTNSRERFHVYKQLKSIPDCDGAGTSHFYAAALLYRSLWDKNWPEKELNSGDTMNSFALRLKNASSLRAYASNHKDVIVNIDSLEQQLDYLSYLTHTIGNFIPIPGRLQQYHLWCNDYWDELLHIVELENTTRKGADKTWPGLKETTQDWVGGFGRAKFDEFIERYYLEVYCDSSGQHKTVRHFKGHSFDNNEDFDLTECLVDMNACIIIRGNRMLAKLIEKWVSWSQYEIPGYITDCVSATKFAPKGFNLNTESFFALFTNDKEIWHGLSTS